MADTYESKPIDKWTVNDLLAYMTDEHHRRFGVGYQPFGSWAAERGRVGQWFGTQRKAGKYDKQLVKDFVDYCFASYKPNAQYPGINFGFMVTYRKTEFQQLERKHNANKAVENADDFTDNDVEDVIDWFNS